MNVDWSRAPSWATKLAKREKVMYWCSVEGYSPLVCAQYVKWSDRDVLNPDSFIMVDSLQREDRWDEARTVKQAIALIELMQ